MTNALLMTHACLAGITKSETWIITAGETEQVATAAGNVLRHYPVPGIDQKVSDWLGLIYALGLVYGTRVWASVGASKTAAPPRPVNQTAAPQQTEPAPTVKASPTAGSANIPGIGKVEIPAELMQ